ncbi:MAG TPA: hypothetical protein VHA30_03845, partial [Patescibacteria group bacterium]|nr:hypothetical protein [Patescibacteria group bacterium]
AVIFAISFLTAGGAAWLKGFEPANNIAAVIAFVVLIVLIVIAAIYIYVWAQVALIHAIKDHAEPIGIKEAFRRSSHKIDAYFMASILVILATVGGFILFIVPGIIFAVWYSLACYIVIGEDAKPVQALKKSRAYVRGSWWSVFGRLLFLILLYLIIYIPVAIVISIIINASGAGKETADTIGQYAGQIVSLLTTPLFAAYGYQVYSNLKALKGPSNIPA